MIKKHSNFKDLNFENFFTGEVIAKGNLILFFPKKSVKNLYVVFKGVFKNNKLRLIEKYIENEKKIIRNWSFEKKSNTLFIGEEKNVRGKIIVRVNKNNLKMRYYFKLLIWKFTVTVLINDYMFLINDKEIVNTTYVSKFGINLAKVVLLYKKIK